MADISGITNNYHVKVSETYASNLSSTIAALASTVSVNSGSPYNDGDYVVLTVEPGTANQATFYGQKSGNTFINCVWTEGNLAVGHTSGKSVVDYDSATHYALVVKSLSTEHDPDGTHGAITPTSITSSGVTWASLITGWQEANATWSYASATSFTQSGDVRTRYPVGSKIRLVQSSTTKYFYVISTSYSSPNTTINITGGTDYTLANAAITSPFYSYAALPQGFPQAFTYGPNLQNLSGGTMNYCKFTITPDNHVVVRFKYTLAGAGVTGAVAISTPTNMSADLTAISEPVLSSILYTDTGTAVYLGTVNWGATNIVGLIASVASTTNTSGAALSATVPHTWAATDVISGTFSYPL